MSEWLRQSLEEAKNNFERMPSWVRESVRNQQGLKDEPATPNRGSRGITGGQESEGGTRERDDD